MGFEFQQAIGWHTSYGHLSSIRYDTILNYGSIAIDNLIGEIEFATKVVAYDFYLIEQAQQGTKLTPLRSLGKYILSRS